MPAHRARVRIFTPDYEMPFAGHPTVGTAIALADLAGSKAPSILVLEENIGPVRCAVGHVGGIAFAEFGLAKLPEPLPFSVEPNVVGAALGLGPHELGFENHRVSYWSAGVPYVTVPVSGLNAAAKARLDNAAWLEFAPRDKGGEAASAYVYCRESVHHDSAFHARMFVPGNSILRGSGDRLGRRRLCRSGGQIRPAGGWPDQTVDRAGDRNGPALAHQAGDRHGAWPRSRPRASAARR